MNRKTCFWLIAVFIVGCTKAAPVGENMELKDSGDAESQQAAQTADTNGDICSQGLTAKDGMCWCGESALAPNDSVLWNCIDGTHYLCLRPDGCQKDDSLFPVWSNLGKHDGSFDKAIPASPKNAKGYRLELKRTNDQLEYQWICRKDKCTCGKGQIRHGSKCADESYLSKSADNRNCGDEVCKFVDEDSWRSDGSVCRDGQCWCGDIRQGRESEKFKCSRGVLICKSDEGCACGSNVCIHDALCRQDKCYCGDVDITDFLDVKNYRCESDEMRCTSDAGCLCGEHRVVKNAECLEGKQYCHGVIYDWLDEKMISQYACDELHPMIVCNDPNGCACGENTCLKGASCIDGECVCGNHYQLSKDVAAHREQYICLDGEYICSEEYGCACSKVKCIKGAACNDSMCVCGDESDVTVERYTNFECNHGDGGIDPQIVCNHSEGCSIGSDDVKCENGEYYYSDYCHEYPSSSGSPSTPRSEGNIRYGLYGSWCGPYEKEIACTDCDQFTYYSYEEEGSCPNYDFAFICKLNGGCNHENKHYQSDKVVMGHDISLYSAQPFIYTGFPDKQYDSSRHGEAVAVCNGIYPLSALRADLKNGTITEIGDTWVCDDAACACGEQSCHLGDLCKAGQCTPYQGCSPRAEVDKFLYYCHGPNQNPIIQPNNKEGYECLSEMRMQEKDEDEPNTSPRHWYCDSKQCACGEHTCPHSSYCEDGECRCGDKVLEDGYRCKNNVPVDARECGGEPLRDGYECMHNHQISANWDSLCGKQKVKRGVVCDHDRVVCQAVQTGHHLGTYYSGWIKASEDVDCPCGDRVLPEGYACLDNQFVCNSETCPCGNTLCSKGDICDNGICRCGVKPNPGCLCGKDVVNDPDGYLCFDEQLICYPDDDYESVDKIRQQECKTDVLYECSCGGEKIPIGAVCQGGHVCKDCPHPFGTKQDGQFTKTCDFNGDRLDIQYEYIFKSKYLDSNDDSLKETEYDICHDPVSQFIDPCDCLHALNKTIIQDITEIQPKQDELSKYYCMIDTRWFSCCSDSHQKEFVKGWTNHEAAVCKNAQTIGMVDQSVVDDPILAEVVYQAGKHTCQCGDSEVPAAEANDYICDMNLYWRCNREDGCACGVVRCKQSQICLAPGVCSQ